MSSIENQLRKADRDSMKEQGVDKRSAFAINQMKEDSKYFKAYKEKLIELRF